jgi:hypothetical protein
MGEWLTKEHRYSTALHDTVAKVASNSPDLAAVDWHMRLGCDDLIVSELAEALRVNTYVRSIDLRGNLGVGDEGARSLVAAIEGGAVHEAWLGETNISRRWRDAIREVCTKNRQVTESISGVLSNLPAPLRSGQRHRTATCGFGARVSPLFEEYMERWRARHRGGHTSQQLTTAHVQAHNYPSSSPPRPHPPVGAAPHDVGSPRQQPRSSEQWESKASTAVKVRHHEAVAQEPLEVGMGAARSSCCSPTNASSPRASEGGLDRLTTHSLQARPRRWWGNDSGGKSCAAAAGGAEGAGSGGGGGPVDTEHDVPGTVCTRRRVHSVAMLGRQSRGSFCDADDAQASPYRQYTPSSKDRVLNGRREGQPRPGGKKSHTARRYPWGLICTEGVHSAR